MANTSLNLFQRMSAVTDAIKAVPKNLEVGVGKSKYRAVAERDILAAVKDAEKEYGIFSYPAERTIVESKEIAVKTDYGEKIQQFVRVATTYRFVNMDKPDEFIEVMAYGDGVDSNDKAPGKAITYSDKYALMKAYKIETGDELDATPSDELAGHDIMKVKTRIQKAITEKMSKGASLADVAKAMNLSETKLQNLIAEYDTLDRFEKALIKAVR